VVNSKQKKRPEKEYNKVRRQLNPGNSSLITLRNVGEKVRKEESIWSPMV
jgi:hypothetical protein